MLEKLIDHAHHRGVPRLLGFMLLKVALSACGAGTRLDGGAFSRPIAEALDPRPVSGVDLAFVGYIEQFEHAWGRSVDDITVRFGDPGDVPALCRSHTLLPGKAEWDHLPLNMRLWKEIVVHRERWDSSSEAKRRLIIFHELGHCALEKGHDERRVQLIATETGEVLTVARSLMASELRSFHLMFPGVYLRSIFDSDAFLAQPHLVDAEGKTYALKTHEN